MYGPYKQEKRNKMKKMNIYGNLLTTYFVLSHLKKHVVATIACSKSPVWFQVVQTRAVIVSQLPAQVWLRLAQENEP